jgi:quinol monooxygenase YgiN
MLTLRIEHEVADFAAWKRIFDADPLHRKESGVLGYRVQQPIDDAGHALVDLQFDDRATAETFMERLEVLWASPEAAAALGSSPRIRLLDVVDEAVL